MRFSGNGVRSSWFFLTTLTFWIPVFPSFQFFAPLKPTRILIEYNSDGVATGEADVHFESYDDAVAAMAKERAQLRK